MTNFTNASRRGFLALAAASAAGARVSVAADPRRESSAELSTATIPAGRRGGVTRVRMEMEIEGNVNISTNPLVSREIDLQLPLASDAVFDYEERPQWFRRNAPTTGANGGPDHEDGKFMVASRFYHEAGSDSRVNKSITQRRLRSAARATIVDREDLPETIYCRDQYLTREEVDLLRCPVCSLTIDHLLPNGDVAVGQTHYPSLSAIGQALNLTSVQTSDVVLSVKSIRPKIIQFQMRGDVVGTASGVPTRIKTIGKLSYDRDTAMLGWVAMAVHETRDIGVAEPGFDLRATIKMVRQPMPTPVGLPASPDRQIADPSVRRSQTVALLESDALNVSAMMDRRWQSMTDVPGAAVWRMTQNDRSVAQCDLRRLPPLAGGQDWSMDDFVADIRKTLGDQLGVIVSKTRSTTPLGLDVLQVTADGSAGGVGVRWTMLHFIAPPQPQASPVVRTPSQQRVLATFTMQSDQIDAFAGSDEQLAATLQIGTSAASTVIGPAASEPKIPSGLDKSPRGSASLPPQTPKRRVNSASDIQTRDLR